jgi:hypothetical protein
MEARHYISEDNILKNTRYQIREEGIILVVTEKTGKDSIVTDKFVSIITRKKNKRERYHWLLKQLN